MEAYESILRQKGRMLPEAEKRLVFFLRLVLGDGTRGVYNGGWAITAVAMIRESECVHVSV